MEWIHLVERHHAVVSIKEFQIGHSRPYFRKNLGIDFGFDNFIEVRGQVYIGKDVSDSMKTLLQKSVTLENTYFLHKFRNQCYKVMEALVSTAQNIKQKNVGQLSNAEIAGSLKEFFEHYRDAGVFVAIFPVIGKRIEEVLTRQLEELGVPNPAENIYVVAHTNKENETTLERINLLQIAARVKKENIADFERDAKIQELVEKHVQEFSWIGVRWFIGKPFTVGEINKRIENLLAQNPQRELDALEASQATARKKAQELLKGKNIDNNTKKFIELAQEYVFLRTYRTERINKANGLLFPFFNEIAKRLGVNYNDVIYLTPEEIIEKLEGGQVNKSIIDARRRGFASLFINNKYSLLSGKELEEFEKREGLARVEKLSADVRGTVAYKGKVTGVARVVLSLDQITKVKSGDVLVAVMTFPAYVPAMEKASAFVTDEGGILCHAAIIAREMQKPCVIGTKTATKVLKDGDLVEVDAEKGIVHKIG